MLIYTGNADAAVELITGIKKQRTPASGKKEKAPLLGKPQQQAAGAASPKMKPKGSPKIESKGANAHVCACVRASLGDEG
jgi:hypothetical protein